MKERAYGKSPLKKIMINSSALLHEALKGIAEIPFIIEVLRAPDGKLINQDGTITEGKIVPWTSDTDVLVTEKGTIIIPNPNKMRLCSPKPLMAKSFID